MSRRWVRCVVFTSNKLPNTERKRASPESRGSTRPGVRGFISDLDKPAFAAIQGKGTKSSKFPIESVSKQLAREQ